MTNRNRGGFGWEAPPAGTKFSDPIFQRPGMSYVGSHDAAQAFDAFVRDQMMRGAAIDPRILADAVRFGVGRTTFGFDAGDASPAPPPHNPLAIHDDPIDMVEINGVWMCEADTRFALGADFDSQPGRNA